MSIRADRDPGAFRGDDPEPLHVEVLAVGICVDLERGPGLGGMASDALPVAGEPRPEVVDASARVGQDLYVRVFQTAEVALRLVVTQAQLRMERSENQVELGKPRTRSRRASTSGSISLAPFGVMSISMLRRTSVPEPRSFTAAMCSPCATRRASSMPFVMRRVFE